MSAILRLLVMLCLATSCVSAVAADRESQSYLYKVPTGTKWHLLGEWDYPDSEKDGLGLHRTNSIVKAGDVYLSVYSANIIGGCCLWPLGIRLEQRSDSSFWDPAAESIYTIGEDGALRVQKRDESVQVLLPTPVSERFSDGWDET